MSHYRKKSNNFFKAAQYGRYEGYYEQEAEKILDQASYSFNKKRLNEAINHALDTRNETKFYELTSLYKDLVERTP